MVVLREYQIEAQAAVRTAWAGGMRRPAIVLPTGAGKTTVFAATARDMAAAGIVSLVLAHRDELIEQAAQRIALMCPGVRVGIVKGAREEIRNRGVIVGSVASLGRDSDAAANRRKALRRAGVRLVIVDEAHHAVADSYMRILRDLGCFDEVPADGSLSGAYALGVTATMSRTDKRGLRQVWEDVVFKRDILWMIRKGYLVHPKGIRVRVAGLDLGRVKKRGGDLAAGELARELHDALAPKAVARAYVEHASGRPAVLFAPSVELAYEMAEALRSEGVRAEAFDGTTAMDDRRGVLARLKSGELDVVANCGVLTEGFDEPRVSCVIMARPTSSNGLYVQMAGRGLRPAPGKDDCLLIDVVGLTGKHKLAGLVNLAGVDRNEELPDELAIYDELPDEEPVDLMDLLDPASALRTKYAAEHPVGPLVVESVELFESSKHVWLRTKQGVWFIEAPGEQLVFLAPEAQVGRYAVCLTGHTDSSGRYLYRHLDQIEAMDRGVSEAGKAIGSVLTRRSESWRRQEPKPAQIARAARIGLDIEGLTKGEVSDLIGAHKASLRLDGMAIVSSVTPDGYWPGVNEGE